MKLYLYGPLAAMAAFAVLPANAAVAPFASFTQSGTAANTGYVNSTSTFTTGTYGSSFTPSVVAVLFNFTDPLLQQFGALDATFSMTATTTGIAQGFGSRRDMAIGGSFSFAYSGPTVTMNGVTLTTGENLLSANFGGDNSSIGGTRGSQSGQVGDDTYSDDAMMVSNVDYASDVLDFSGTTDRSFGMTLTSVLTSLSVNSTNGRFNDFRSSAVGTFSSDPAPVVNGAVPEISTWAMMVIGFGAVGMGLRGSRRAKVQFI